MNYKQIFLFMIENIYIHKNGAGSAKHEDKCALTLDAVTQSL